MLSIAHRMLARFTIVACLGLFAIAALAQANKQTFKVESTLELDFGKDDESGQFGVSGVRAVERRLLSFPYMHVTYDRDAFIVLEVEIRREEKRGDKGVEGTVRVVAWQYGPEAQRRKIYTIEKPGMDMYVDDLFVVTESYSDSGSSNWRRNFFKYTGGFAYEGYGQTPQAYFTTEENPDKKIFRSAGFTPWTYDMPKVAGIDGGIIGLLTYMDDRQVFSRMLLVHKDPKAAWLLSHITDEKHQFAFVDRYRRAEPQGDPMTTPFWGQKLRLRFHSSNLDLYFPVKEDGFDTEDTLQSLPPGFSLVPYVPAKP
ncbi:hypothetical protein [Ferrovibrio sp.]|uniref:hypothetical protein n=1 Tax=Ferrovibrio sp. TaxID=1917215 RepID=UPI002605D543|nr:hypothetical protein [Ferrovibrio sp.]